ncbi:hypothetical protein T492DRAFT_1142968 [Pavlovales sp. CCMP2436]|nr:hypothetical protein T492DRAFT_1142968 [Pavlovales sp. CCMP2436]|mmetsp:Transcript_5107/g.13271  ORF Transcript_5107/g.13271 Transcript_5107/m.13271 type:complete len:570 (-) Transcript_5107:84-1793(-)
MRASAFARALALVPAMVPMVLHASAVPLGRLGHASCTGCGGMGSRRAWSKRDKVLRRTGGADAGAVPPETRAACKQCAGDGVVRSEVVREPALAALRPLGLGDADDARPLVAIVGGGIAGAAVALGLQQRGLRALVFEADGAFDERAQGYALTLQQGNSALRRFGVSLAEQGIVHRAHISMDASGAQLGRFGDGRSVASEGGDAAASARVQRGRSNLLVPRQMLRASLLAELAPGTVRWGHRLLAAERTASGVRLAFSTRKWPRPAEPRAADGLAEAAGDADAGEGGPATVSVEAALVIGADGIWSSLRQKLLPTPLAQPAASLLDAPLRYLGLIVILGRARCEHSLGEERHIWEVVDGSARLYAMPYDESLTMWQLSFPLDLEQARTLGRAGGGALRDAALAATSGWCAPVPQLLGATAAGDITGYPAFDRPLPDPDELRTALGPAAVLVGDAVHPMSPFKGQGANQALIDGLELARALSAVPSLGPPPPGLREPALSLDDALGAFERAMLERARVKVEASARAAKFLHSAPALATGNCTRVSAARGKGGPTACGRGTGGGTAGADAP